MRATPPVPLSAAEINAGDLVTNGVVNFPVLLLTRLYNGDSASEQFATRVAEYAAAGGAILTEWDAHVMFFTDKAPTLRSLASPYFQTGNLAGTADGGASLPVDLDIVQTGNPIVNGIPNPWPTSPATEFYYTVNNIDPALNIVGTFTGGAFTEAPTLAQGCCGSTPFIFGMFDYQDSPFDPLVQQFVANSLDVLLDPNTCPPGDGCSSPLVTSTPTSGPTSTPTSGPTPASTVCECPISCNTEAVTTGSCEYEVALVCEEGWTGEVCFFCDDAGNFFAQGEITANDTTCSVDVGPSMLTEYSVSCTDANGETAQFDASKSTLESSSKGSKGGSMGKSSKGGRKGRGGPARQLRKKESKPGKSKGKGSFTPLVCAV